jgi:hypothetical protein
MSNRTKDMSKDSTQNIPQEATKLKKLAKATARYMEMEEFKDSDHHKGYFCHNCVYFMKPNHCAIVTDEGPDVYGKTSGEIAPHGICALWEPNENEMHSSSNSGRQGKSDESTTNVSASFSCEICNQKFNSREVLKQHTIKEHTDNTSEGYNK